ncbi:MAG TPA: phage tail protein, partial [Longimicrobiales bacterium]|nr:phage tail protein [Longimicrobiales bacterium]
TLFQEVRGRYLQLRVTLEGDSRATPVVRALRIYYPRFSYLAEYLPEAYREEPASASFLDRYLANVEGTYTTVEDRIANVQVLFDPAGTPAEYLDWLAGWQGLALDAGWSEDTRRRFLLIAPRMIRQRGTATGLARLVRLALDPCPTPAVFEAESAGAVGGGVRIIEDFRRRGAPGVVLGDPSDMLGPGSTTVSSGWTPALGAEPLHAEFRAFLASQYDTVDALNASYGTDYTGFDDPALRLPALPPRLAAAADDWRRFTEAEIGFTYAIPTDADAAAYRDFLARQYRRPAALNDAYGLSGSAALTSWANVTTKLWNGRLRNSLPNAGPALRDWTKFVSVLLPLRRHAHRFTLLVPVGLDEPLEDQNRKRDVANRIAQAEKPAHTEVTVRLYWNAFRVGEARIGIDAQLAGGSRWYALILNRNRLGESMLGRTGAAAEPDRRVLGVERGLGTRATCHRG